MLRARSAAWPIRPPRAPHARVHDIARLCHCMPPRRPPSALAELGVRSRPRFPCFPAICTLFAHPQRPRGRGGVPRTAARGETRLTGVAARSRRQRVGAQYGPVQER